MIDFISITTYLVCLISYLLGCFPSAFVLIKLFFNINILEKGTGNVGAMNSYDVTKKKWVGIAVLLLDALKAVLAIVISASIGDNNQYLLSFSAFFVILGHNFNVFLGLRGGRGLASASAISIITNILAVLLWVIIWGVTFKFIRKNVHIANVIATIWSPLIILILPDNFINSFSSFFFIEADLFKFLLILLSLLILIRHIKPIVELYKSKNV